MEANLFSRDTEKQTLLVKVGKVRTSDKDFIAVFAFRLLQQLQLVFVVGQEQKSAGKSPNGVKTETTLPHSI